MQPILILAIAAVAAIGLGTGFLNNDFVVMVQQFGIGQGNIDTPITKATVDFNINSIQDPTSGFFKNVVDKCFVTLDAANGFGVKVGETISPTDNTVNGVVLGKTSELWCKLTNMNHDVIAEGVLKQDQFAGPGTYTVDITLPATGFPLATAVDDVTIIAHANEYSNQVRYLPSPPEVP